MPSALDNVVYVAREKCPLHDESADGRPNSLRHYASIDDKVTGRSFKIMRCAACGTGLTDPYPSESTVKWLYLGRESVSNFDPIRGTIMDWVKDIFARSDIRRAHALGGSPDVASVLDFGAGSGRFSLASKQVFPKSSVDAVDFDEQPPPYLRNVPGVRYLPMASFLQETRQYDLIVLRGVLEHVHDPIGMLRSLGQRLTPRGSLYLEVPNIDSAYIHYCGRGCNAYGVPYHLFNFDPASFHAVIRQSGLTGKMFPKGLPLAGCVLANTLGQQRNLAHQFAGIMLHPLQLLLEWRGGKYVLAAVCKRA